MIKVHLGCGNFHKDGFINVDIDDPSADVHFDLNNPWTFVEPGTVDYVYSSNCFEHLNSHFHCMNELYKILKVGGIAELCLPSTDGRGAFQDPTHKIFWNKNSWRYWCSNNDFGLTKMNQGNGFKGDFKLLEISEFTVPENIVFTNVKLEKIAV